MSARSGRVAVGVVRIALGVVLLVAAVLKLHDGPTAAITTVAGYRLLPPLAVTVLGIVLPYVEFALGAYLALGFYTRGTALVVCAQFVVFAGAVASLVVRGIPADCGCFGSGLPTPPSWGHVAADLGLAALAGLVARFAPGAFAIDRDAAARHGAPRAESRSR